MINEKNEEYFQMIRDFTLFSDFFMYEVFSRNRSAATLMARILTGKEHLMIKRYGMEVKKGFPFFPPCPIRSICRRYEKQCVQLRDRK